MKYALFVAAALALASAPTYSGLSELVAGNGMLIGALVPGTAPLFDRPGRETTEVASVE